MFGRRLRWYVRSRLWYDRLYMSYEQENIVS